MGMLTRQVSVMVYLSFYFIDVMWNNFLLKYHINLQTILEGMKFLACIKKITEHALEVELPGLIIGKVLIDSISDALVKTLKDALSDSSKITSVSTNNLMIT